LIDEDDVTKNWLNRRRWGWGAALLAFAAAGCGGKSVDLDASSDAEASADPGTVIDERELATLLAVDDQRLYWSTTEKVRSCSKTDCTSSLVDYPAAPHVSGAEIDGVYWLAPYAGELFWRTAHEVLACPASGCAGSPRVVASAFYGAYAVDEEGVFAVTSDGVYLAPREGGPWSLLADLPAGQGPGSAVAHGPHLYWTRETEDAQVTVGRVRKDGSSKPEVLAHVDTLRGGSSALGVNDTHVYFADMRQAGAIFRCPLAGCAGSPENLFGPVRSPAQLAVDNDQLCVVYGKELSDTRVGCWLTHEVPKLTDEFARAESVVMDASDVYVSRTLLERGTLEFDASPVVRISRVAR
jgi:hypothetical protein